MQSSCFKRSLGLLFLVLLLAITLPTTAKETPKKETQRVEKKEQAKQSRPKFPKESFATKLKRRAKKVGVYTGFISQICGNSTVEGIEECDDGNLLNGDGCSCACAHEVAGPEQCGNNICEVGEDETCWPDCCFELTCNAPPYHEKRCGNCIQEAPLEECDDGNTVAGDGCVQCKDEPVCGDGAVNEGETCDDGNTVNGDQCNSDCTYPRCGDSVVNSWESCDDGNLANGDGCSALCMSESAGPSGYEIPECSQAAADIASSLGYDAEDFLNLPDCACDNPELTCECETATPQASCNLNGVVEPGEECDDGNNNEEDGCSSDCRRSCQLFAQSCGISHCNSDHWSKPVAGLCKPDLLGNVYCWGDNKLTKLDACGLKRWSRPSYHFKFTHLAVSPEGYVYLVGRPEGFPPNDWPSVPVALKKYNPCGGLVWETMIDYFSPTLATNFSAILSEDDVVVGGAFLSGPDLINKYSITTGQLEEVLASWPDGGENGEAPLDLDAGPDGSLYFWVYRLYANTPDRFCLRKINTAGDLVSPFGGETDGLVAIPSAIEPKLRVDAAGNIYVLFIPMETGGKKIIKFNPFGFQLQTFLLTGAAWEGYHFYDIEIDLSGNIYLSGIHSISPEQQPPEFVPDSSGNWGFSETKKTKLLYDIYPAVRKLSPVGEILWTNSVVYSNYAICASGNCSWANIEIGIDGSVHVITNGGIIKHPTDGTTYPP